MIEVTIKKVFFIFFSNMIFAVKTIKLAEK